ncbi:MAG TPA: glycosyltransferase [Fibrobacteraceae bacterium]|nr:glycosyltransferase [Fibrobacteraceae bacterium]
MTIIDFNNFWSPSGGGVRRYHLEKMKYYTSESKNLLVFVMPDSKTYTEEVSSSLIVEHVKAFKMPLYNGYRFIWKKKQIAPYLKKYNPDVIEVGSPYILPKAVSKQALQICPQAKLLGFWHADFPITYVQRAFTRFFGKKIGAFARKLAFLYAHYQFKNYHGIQVSCKEIIERLESEQFKNLFWIPLGCNIELFSPNKRDEALVKELKQGDEKRSIIFFPHRFSKEKGLDLFLKAYSILAEKMNPVPAVVFAGTGPLQLLIDVALKKYKHLHYVGFLSSEEEMARYYASANIGVALSAWETFGLSILESMACGNALIGASAGAAREHVSSSGAGLILESYKADALAKCLLELCEQDLTQKQKAARLYAEKFSWDNCFSNQLKIYSTIISSRKS